MLNIIMVSLTVALLAVIIAAPLVLLLAGRLQSMRRKGAAQDAESA